ncbi:MAG TPA: DCC1-like thiol-disulfide oxidoreductase family protein [Fimbriimonadaceae bacterium]|nr:DCC1-like thiol-disulfide oxidoreductase family protein [Fimbriimonadaceae bacterium]
MDGEHVRQVILYDGVCGLCDRTVQFVLARDRSGLFHFAPIQSEYAAGLLRRHGIDAAELNTLYLVRDVSQPGERLLVRGRAVLAILTQLGKLWPLLHVLRVLPPFLLDAGYGLVARNRYRMFGKFDSCRLPSAAQRSRFLR